MVKTRVTIFGALALVSIVGCAQVLGGLDDPKNSDGGTTDTDGGTSTGTDASGVTSGGTATVSGSVGGVMYKPGDVVGVFDSQVSTPGAFYAGVVISSRVNLCSRLLSTSPHEGEEFLFVFVGAEVALTPRTYTINQGEFTAAGSAQAFTSVLDSTCTGAANTAESGSVIIKTVKSTSVAGDFSITLEDGTSLTGTFDAPVCAGYTFNDINNGTGATPTCTP